MLKVLVQRHEVALVTFYREQPDDPHSQLKQMFRKVVAVPLRLPESRSIGDMFLYASTLRSGLPHSMAKYHRPAVRRAIANVLRDSFDVIVCDFIIPAGLLDWSGRT